MNPSNQAQSATENLEKPYMLRQLEDFGNLVSECNRYTLLERNAEQNRHTVRPHIYARVKNEYADRRGALDQEEERQRGVLRARFDKVLEKRKALNERCRQEADRLEELDFRVRVGEFQEEEVKDSRTELKEQLLEITKALADAQEIVDKFEQVGVLAQAPSPVSKTGVEGWDEDSEDQADFLVLEEDPSSADQDSPVVNYPPESPASSSLAGTGERAKAPESRTRRRSHYVAGYLVALDGSRQGERFPLISSDITVGSSRGIDIRLADSGIARFHARIVYKKGKHYFKKTVDESGSCLVNGVQAYSAELKDGDVLCLGKTKMQVEYAREANA